ncbi:MAG: hypothetical protein V1929_02055 [bacterium]
MSVHWIESTDGTVETAMKNVAKALEDSQNLTFLPPEDLKDYTDPAFREQKEVALRAADMTMSPQVTQARPEDPALARKIKPPLHRALWYVMHPRFEQIHAFQSAMLRIVDSMASTLNHALRRIRALEATDTSARIESTEKQLELLCDEHRELRKRMTDVERRGQRGK